MGYSTTYEGSLEITAASLKGLRRLNSILGEDRRDHEEFNLCSLEDSMSYWYYVDLEIEESDTTELVWNGREKSRVCPDMIRAIVTYVRRVDPSFALKGTMYAQGESYGDVWTLVVDSENGVYQKITQEDVLSKKEEALQEAEIALRKLVSRIRRLHGLRTQLEQDTSQGSSGCADERLAHIDAEFRALEAVASSYYHLLSIGE